MALNSDERREVAARLREQLRYMREDNCYDEDLNAVYCGNAAYRNIAGSVEPYGNFGRGNYVHIVERVADLIDPTCKVVPFDEESMRLPHCSVCMHPILKPWPNFCPNCGARVVSNNGE